MGGAFDVAARAAYEVAHEVVHISADIAGFAEFRGVGLHKWNADEIGGGADEVGFPDASWSEEQNILFLIERSLFALERQAHMLKVVAEGHPEHFLGLVLADDKAVEMPGDIRRLEREGKFLRGSRLAADRGFGDRGFVDAAELFRNACRDGTECVWFHEMFSSLSMATRRW